MLGPQPFGFTKEKIISNRKIIELIEAAFEYRNSKGIALKVNINHLNFEIREKYAKDI